MKKTILLVLSALMISLAGMAQSQTSNQEIASLPLAMAKFNWLKTETIDLGTIEKGKPVTVTFEFVNSGNHPLVISSAKGQCGCTSVEYSKQAIAPNEKGFVKATYNAAVQGVFSKSIVVAANTKEQEIQLTLKGVVN